MPAEDQKPVMDSLTERQRRQAELRQADQDRTLLAMQQLVTIPGHGSRGPVVNTDGKVIGMDTAAASSGTGGASLCFAIPASTVQTIAGEIVAHKNLPGLVYGRRPFLGIEIVNSSQTANGFSPFSPSGNPFRPGTGRNHTQRHSRGRCRRRRSGQASGKGRDRQR
jgi:S1-C subfamily serine protease